MKHIFSTFLKILIGLLLVLLIGAGLLLAWGAYRISQHSRQPLERWYSGAGSAQKRPIILVHGLNRSARMWAVADDGHGNGIPETISMVDFLKSRGFPNIYLNTFADTRNASLVENARILKMWIDKTKKRFNAGKVDIISHSMGALVARAYLQEMDLKDGSRVSSLSYEDDVANLVMIAAPHLGSPLADSIPSVTGWYAQRTLSEGGGPDLRRLNSLPVSCEVNFHSIIVSASPRKRQRWSPWWLLRSLVSLKAPIDGDGTVSLKSQDLEEASSFTKCKLRRHFRHSVNVRRGIRHRDAPHSPAIQREIFEILSAEGSGSGNEPRR